MKKLPYRLILSTLTVALLVALFGCFGCAHYDVLYGPRREFVTEDPPIRDPDSTYVETVEETYLHGYVLAVCGDDLIRVQVNQGQTESWGEIVYVRGPDTEERESWYHWYYIYITYDTVELSNNPDDLPILIAKEADISAPAAKPVIYLYPEAPTEVSVELTLDGILTCTYPDYAQGWDGFTAHPDGTLVFPDGKEYYCLYWEGFQAVEWDFSKGFCVKGEDTAAFLEWALAKQGLTPREANEFIIYWLPLMQENPYNVIAFQTDLYTEGAALEITPAPDSLLRVFMAYYPADEAVDLPRQELEGFERRGFTVVEWGGSQVRRPSASPVD